MSAPNPPEYLRLLAHVDAEGLVSCRWQLSKAELEQVRVPGRTWYPLLLAKKPVLEVQK